MCWQGDRTLFHSRVCGSHAIRRLVFSDMGKEGVVVLSCDRDSEAGPVEVADLTGMRAWEQAVDRFGPMLWTIATSNGLTGAEAASVFRTTWLRLADRFAPTDAPEQLAEWLGAVARRESVRILKLSGREVPAGTDLLDL